jgi:Glycosyltransferase family 87
VYVSLGLNGVTGILPENPRFGGRELWRNHCWRFCDCFDRLGGVRNGAVTKTNSLILWMKTLMLLVLLGAFTAFLCAHFSASSRGTDFPDFYSASRMLIEGQGHELYDAQVQRQFQSRYVGRVGTLYIHPPFEALFYLTVAWLPLNNAYALWTVLNLAFLGIITRKLTNDVLPTWDWRLLLIASLTFIPVLLNFLQGQDSVLLLLFVTLAFTALRCNRGFAAGCWLGLGLFKFELVLPLAFVLALHKGRTGFLRGFALIALALAGVSVAVSGRTVFAAYPRFLLHLQEQPYAGIFPPAMANLRGLSYLLFHNDRSPFAIFTIAALSVSALFVARISWQDRRLATYSNYAPTNRLAFDIAFGNTVLFALFASYHLNPHDLSLVLLPMSLLLYHVRVGTIVVFSKPSRWVAQGVVALLFLPPLHLLALVEHVYALVAVPLFALFITGTILLRRSQAEQRLPQSSSLNHLPQRTTPPT